MWCKSCPDISVREEDDEINGLFVVFLVRFGVAAVIQRLDRSLARSDGHSPAYSGKQRVSGDRRIFSSKRSFLLRNRMMEVSPNHLLLHIESNSLSDSCIRFWNRKAEAHCTIFQGNPQWNDTSNPSAPDGRERSGQHLERIWATSNEPFLRKVQKTSKIALFGPFCGPILTFKTPYSLPQHPRWP